MGFSFAFGMGRIHFERSSTMGRMKNEEERKCTNGNGWRKRIDVISTVHHIRNMKRTFFATNTTITAATTHNTAATIMAPPLPPPL
jgi:hypothetical protein